MSLRQNAHRMIAVVLLAFFSLASGLWSRDLRIVSELHTPDRDFFGAISFVSSGNDKWICEIDRICRVEVTPFNTRAGGDYWNPSATYTLFMFRPDTGSYDCVSTHDIETTGDYRTAFKIEQDVNGWRINGPGGKTLFAEILMGLPRISPATPIRLYSTSEKNPIEVLNRLETFPQTGHIQIDATADYQNLEWPCGTWRYLDRVTPKNHRSVLGGRYTLAVVGDDDSDDLLIVYVDGAENADTIWKTGDVKGRLKPTVFEGHYDLIWYDSSKNEVGIGECSATFEGYDILRLDFPLLESQIRLRREPG